MDINSIVLVISTLANLAALAGYIEGHMAKHAAAADFKKPESLSNVS